MTDSNQLGQKIDKAQTSQSIYQMMRHGKTRLCHFRVSIVNLSRIFFYIKVKVTCSDLELALNYQATY